MDPVAPKHLQKIDVNISLKLLVRQRFLSREAGFDELGEQVLSFVELELEVGVCVFVVCGLLAEKRTALLLDHRLDVLLEFVEGGDHFTNTRVERQFDRNEAS